MFSALNDAGYFDCLSASLGKFQNQAQNLNRMLLTFYYQFRETLSVPAMNGR